jgi:hypothetical protein
MPTYTLMSTLTPEGRQSGRPDLVRSKARGAINQRSNSAFPLRPSLCRSNRMHLPLVNDRLEALRCQ